jgi:hypothetical protein
MKKKKLKCKLCEIGVCADHEPTECDAQIFGEGYHTIDCATEKPMETGIVYIRDTGWIASEPFKALVEAEYKKKLIKKVKTDFRLRLDDLWEEFDCEQITSEQLFDKVLDEVEAVIKE